jgi:hypothetical protein
MMAASRATALARSCEPPLELARRRTERAAASGWGRATTAPVVVRVPQGLHGLRRWRRCQATAVRRSSSGRAPRPRRPTGPPLPRGIRRRRQRRSLGREKLGGGLPPVANQTGDGDHLPPWCFFFFLWPNPTDKPRLCPIRPPKAPPPSPRMPPPPPLSAAAAIATASSCCSTRRRSSTPSTAARSSQSQQHARRWWGLVVFPWGRRRWWPKPLRDGLAAPQLLLPHRTAAAQPRARDGGSARVARGPGRQVRRHDLARGGGVEVDGDRADAGD